MSEWSIASQPSRSDSNVTYKKDIQQNQTDLYQTVDWAPVSVISQVSKSGADMRRRNSKT